MLAPWTARSDLAVALRAADPGIRSAAVGFRRNMPCGGVCLGYLASALSALSGWRYARPDAAVACLPVLSVLRVAMPHGALQCCAAMCYSASTLRGRMGMAVFVSAWEQL
ncbi:hypothetical protein FHY15_003576 [Xanthomonas arboricola]|uniref:hypothetical protein n=1 Tax=Xanthomonas arboricola TaxID=56448 RepID=UPI00141BA647|nr:hypothetical protein [Xanthomonas arboricola]NIK34395.1 hypothetical protein [Xanthomonas arboricola]